jgi:hypothetical protein
MPLHKQQHGAMFEAETPFKAVDLLFFRRKSG